MMSRGNNHIFDLLVLDVDGVMTNGTKTYDADHNVVSKTFCDVDFTAIKRFKQNGIEVILLSGDSFNEGMAHKRGIEFWKSTITNMRSNKPELIEDIAKKYDVGIENVAYVGDDFFDIETLEKVGSSFCPLGCPVEVTHAVKGIICEKSGEGVVAALYDDRVIY